MVFAVATGLRIWGIGFGLPHTLARPDEDAVASVALRFFGRTFHPGFFDWPSLFMYAVCVLWVVYFNVGRFAGWRGFAFESGFSHYIALNPTPFYLMARGLSALAGVLTVWNVHRIGVLLFDRTTALVGALFLAVAALHVRDSHFGVTDVAATWLVTQSFLSTVQYARGGKRRDAIASAVWAGMAASTKYNAGIIAITGIWTIASGWGTASAWSARIRLAIVYCAVAAVAFVAGTPYALLDLPAFAKALAEVAAHLQGGQAALAGYGWEVHLTTSLRHGLGLPMLVAGLAGLMLYCWRDRRRALLFALFPVVYFAIVGAGLTTFARYVIPVVPFLCLAGGHATVVVARSIASRADRATLAPALTWTLAAMVAAPSAWSALQTDRLLTRTDNRLMAARWIHDRFPTGATIYQAGSTYGHVQMQTADPVDASRYRDVSLDNSAFRDAAGGGTIAPELIVVQECPLPVYCSVPDEIRRRLSREYVLERVFTALDALRPGLVYDRDDAFFVPLAGFDAVERPGPNLSIYRRRDTVEAKASLFPALR
jgi:Dolichyl-phosphate-mannose-protein mannosyltransferase